jgi:hypothetical protein
MSWGALHTSAVVESVKGPQLNNPSPLFSDVGYCIGWLWKWHTVMQPYVPDRLFVRYESGDEYAESEGRRGRRWADGAIPRWRL